MQFYFSWIFTNISLWHTGKFFFIYSLFAFSFCKASMQPFLFCFLLIYFTLLFIVQLYIMFISMLFSYHVQNFFYIKFCIISFL